MEPARLTMSSPPGTGGQFGTGVLGSSGSHAFPPPAPRANTGVMGVASGSSTAGVYGYAAQNGGAVGVRGQSTLG